MKARASVKRKPDAHVFLKGQILDEDFPLYQETNQSLA